MTWHSPIEDSNGCMVRIQPFVNAADKAKESIQKQKGRKNYIYVLVLEQPSQDCDLIIEIP